MLISVMLIVLTKTLGRYCMAQTNNESNLKERLILAGLKELEKHGIKDFSLRRVANVAEVSCAAPYRHFKNKDELISAIIDYIRNDWLLLCNQITEIITKKEQLIKELCSACVRFWIGNGNFLSVLFLIQSSTNPEQKRTLILFDSPIVDAISKHCVEKEIIRSKEVILKNAIPSLIYGTVMLITRGSTPPEEAIQNMKLTIDELLK